MTQVNQTFDTHDAVGNRESLADKVDTITPKLTPAYSMFGEEKIEAVKHTWQTDSLAAPDIDNAHVQGAVYDYNSVSPTTLVGNYTQIFRKEFIISETQEAVKKAGGGTSVKREKLKKGQEIKIDQEVSFLSNNASVAGSSSVASKSGGLRAWCATNDSLGSGGASGGYNSSTGVVDAATNGTQRAFTKALLDDNIQSTYMAGGTPDALMVSPYVKRVFSTFMSDSNVSAFRTAISGKEQGTITGAADVYVSDFGTIDVIPNQQMARIGATVARNAFLISRDKVSRGILRPIQQDKNVAKTSDGLPCVIKAETTLIVKNEAAIGVIADLYGMTSAT